IDVAILLALAPLTPGLPWRRRMRIVAMALPPLVAIHVLGLVLSMREAYARVPLVHPELAAGPMASRLSAIFHSLLLSEVSLLVPFVLWGGLALWERSRLPDARAGRRKA